MSSADQTDRLHDLLQRDADGTLTGAERVELDALVPLEGSEAPEALTPWHPMLVALLDVYLPSGWRLIPELILTRLPQRIDIVILQLVSEHPGAPTKLHSIFDYLRPHTLIEHKGPTDDLCAEDALVLLGYGAQYMRLKKVKDPAEVCLMVVADRIRKGFVDQVGRLGGRFVRAGKGLWRGKLAGATLRGVETGEASGRSPTERLLYAFSRAFLRDPRRGMPLDEDAQRVYALLEDQVEQFRRTRGPSAMKYAELAKKSLKELMQPVLERMTPEERLAGLTPEQRLAGLTREEVAKLLTPEQRLAGLTREEIERALAARPRAARTHAKRRPR